MASALDRLYLWQSRFGRIVSAAGAIEGVATAGHVVTKAATLPNDMRENGEYLQDHARAYVEMRMEDRGEVEPLEPWAWEEEEEEEEEWPEDGWYDGDEYVEDATGYWHE